MLTTLWAWVVLKLLGLWAHAMEGTAVVFVEHKTAVFVALVFGVTLALSGSNADRYLIVASMIAAYFLGVRYPI